MATLLRKQDTDIETLEEERRRRAVLVEHVRKLLSRADARREAEPENYRKWNRVLDNLEAALSEAKFELERCDRCIENERRWHQMLEETGVPAEEILPQPCTPPDGSDVITRENPGNPEAATAARMLLETPLETVEAAPLEQVALAQTYLAWRRKSGLANGADRRLAGRIELAIQGRNGKAAKPTVTRTLQERRQQRALRDVVAKIQWKRLDTLTIRDLELAVECCTVLAQRPGLDSSEQRLKGILLQAITEVDRSLNNLRNRMTGKVSENSP